MSSSPSLPTALCPRPRHWHPLAGRPAWNSRPQGFQPRWADACLLDAAARDRVQAHLARRALLGVGQGWPLVLGGEAMAGQAPEACTLRLWQGECHARSTGEAGLHRAVEVLAGLWEAGAGPAMEVADGPVHAWRGVMLDCSRHFWPVAVVERVVDELARLGGNRLHLHLTDDQGWRLPLPGRPELEELAAWRVERDGSRHGGMYTALELRGLVRTAAELGVEILPEVDLPGHCGALLAAMPQLSCHGRAESPPRAWGCHEALLCLGHARLPAFLDELLDALTAIFPFPHIHLGGDEVAHGAWLRCPRCRQRLSELGTEDPARLAGVWLTLAEQRLRAHGRRGAYWDEALDHLEEPGSLVFAWRGEEALRRALAAGHATVACPLHPCYLDFYPGLEEGQPRAIGGHNSWQALRAFDPADLGRTVGGGRLLGGQGNLWTEYVEDEDLLMQRLQPRLAALMEALWCGREADASAPEAFAKRLPDIVRAQWTRGWSARVDAPRLLDPPLALPGQPLEVRLEVWPTGTLQCAEDGATWREVDAPVVEDATPAHPVLRLAPEQDSRRLQVRQLLPGGACSAPLPLHLRREDPWPARRGGESVAQFQVEGRWLRAPASDWRQVAHDRRLPMLHLPDWRWPTEAWRALPALDAGPIAPESPWAKEPPTPALPEIVPTGLRRGLQRLGWLHVPATGRWRFTLRSASLARLWVDGRLVLDQDGFRPGGALEALLPLAQGAHQLRLDWLDLRGGACDVEFSAQE